MSIKQKLARGIFRAKKFAVKNGPTICTVVGCVGVAATGVLAWMGRAKCDDILESLDEGSSTFDKVKATAPAWGPVVGVGLLSVGAIIFGNGLSKRQIAALSATSAMNAAALTRTRQAVDERAKELEEAMAKKENDLLGLPDDERRQGIFECDCDNNVYCLNPDGELYWDDWTNIWFRQLPSIVENGYYAFNRLYANKGAASVYDLYKLWGFGATGAWSPHVLSDKFKDIGWEKLIAFDPNEDRPRAMFDVDLNGMSDIISESGEDFIDFREINGKHMRIFGAANTVSDWPRQGSYTRITYLFVPHELYVPFMSDDDLDAYLYNASYFGQRRFDGPDMPLPFK